VQIKLSNNAKVVGAKLKGISRKQIPFATSVAINRTADKAALTARLLAKQTFDRPVPFLLNNIIGTKGGARYKFRGQLATKRRLNATIAPGAGRSMTFSPAGKRINQVLLREAKGGVLTPKGRAHPVPTMKMRRSRYGGLTRNAIKNLLSRPNVVQLGYRNGVKPGIYRRDRRNNLVMLIAWEDQVHYRPIYPFYRAVRRTVQNHLHREYRKAIKHAMKTAKP
tara:strand:+ start:1939 stop:2607 length:669 start_codon:yes stop_codon:yes gene_type:complete